MSSTEVNLDRIASSLEKIVEILSTQFSATPIQTHLHVPGNEPSAEEDFFIRTTRIYYEEEKLRRARQGQRKSARRVSERLGNELTDFFSRHLPQYDVSSHQGLVFFYEDGAIVAILKYITDLGYNRGDNWFDYIDSVVDLCQSQYNVPPSRVYFIVCSMLNGLDNTHVRKVLGTEVSNSELVMDRELLKSYLDKYIGNIKALPDPASQVFFAGADLHPNALATEWLNTGIEPKCLPTYPWLKPSVSDLIKRLSETK